MKDNGFWARAMGRTPKQQEQLRQRIAHPVRAGFFFGAPYAIGLGVVFFLKDGPSGVVFAGIAGVLYGWGMVIWMRRRLRKLDDASAAQ